MDRDEYGRALSAEELDRLLDDVNRTLQISDANIGQKLRCLLFHSSLVSLAENLSAGWILSALENGCITLNRSLKYARLIPDEKESVDALMDLSFHVPVAERQSIVNEIIGFTSTDIFIGTGGLVRIVEKLAVLGYSDEALKIARRADICKSEALMKIAPHVAEPLKTDLYVEAFREACGIDTLSIRAGQVQDCIPHLSETLRREAVAIGVSAAREARNEAVRYPDEESYRLYLLASFLPYVEEPFRTELVEEVLTAARAIEDPETRASGYAGMLYFLPADRYVEILNDALATARSVAKPKRRAWLLGALIPRLGTDLAQTVLSEALDALSQIRDQDEAAKTVAHLAPHFPLGLALQFAKQLQASNRGWSSGWALSEIALRLQQLNCVDEAAAAAKAIKDDGLRCTALSKIVAAKSSVIDLELDWMTQSIGDAGFRTQALIGLASHLGEEYQREALNLLSSLSLWEPFGYHQIQAISDLAPRLPPPLVCRVLEQIQKTPNELMSIAPRMALLDCLLPKLDGDLRRTVLEKALADARATKKKPQRVEILASLSKYCSEGDRLEVLQEALSDAIRTTSQFARARSLEALGKHLPQELLQQAAVAAEEIQDGYVDGLIGIGPYLQEPDRSLVMGKLFVASLQSGWRIEDVVSQLPDSVLPEARDFVMREENTGIGVRILSRLAPRFAELGRTEEAFELLPPIPPGELGEAIDRMASFLHGHSLPRAFEIATSIQGKYQQHSRCMAFAGLAPYLSEEMRIPALHDALRIVCTRDTTDSTGVKLWSKLVPGFLSLSPAGFDSLWSQLCRMRTHVRRKETCCDIYLMRDVIAKFGGTAALEESYNSIQDVGRLWP